MGRCITCCKDCPNRHPGCHGSCETYQKQKAEYDEKMAEYRKSREVELGITHQRFESLNKVTNQRLYRSKYRKGH